MKTTLALLFLGATGALSFGFVNADEARAHRAARDSASAAEAAPLDDGDFSPDEDELMKHAKVFARSNETRAAWLKGGIEKLTTLRDEIKDNKPPSNAAVLKAVKSWLHLVASQPSGDRDPTVAELDLLIGRFEKNGASTATVTFAPAACPFTPACGDNDFACTLDQQVHLQQKWFDSSVTCQDSSLTHEYFHAIGLHDIAPTDKVKCNDSANLTVTQALGAPDCLAGLACELEKGSGCSTPC
ncbi:MAG: hypothetical protein U0414_04015 [Polyangiaceae bacterium]